MIGVNHSYVVNPCGVGVGKDAYFRIQVLPSDYPDEKIVWSNETAGAVEFVGGNTGRAVTVRGVSPGTTHLSIHIGDSPSDPPHFPLKVVTNRVFHVKPWVVRKRDGMLTRSDLDLQSMINEVNDIYAQIGVSFVIEPTGVVEDSGAVDVYYFATNAVSSTEWSRDRLFYLSSGNNLINCFFVNRFLEYQERGTVGVWCPEVIVMVERASAIVWAHELGHQLGADDIYSIRGDKSVISVNFSKGHAEMDWSNGCHRFGAGYYTRDIKCEQIIDRLLMNGQGDLGETTTRDITAGGVFGVVVGDNDNPRIDDASIGLLNR